MPTSQTAERSCATLFIPGGEQNQTVLGASFLRSYYAVFAWDSAASTGTVGLANSIPSSSSFTSVSSQDSQANGTTNAAGNGAVGLQQAPPQAAPSHKPLASEPPPPPYAVSVTHRNSSSGSFSAGHHSNRGDSEGSRAHEGSLQDAGAATDHNSPAEGRHKGNNNSGDNDDYNEYDDDSSADDD